MAGKAGSYRPPAVGRYQPTGAMKASTAASMRKMADEMEQRHPDLGAHQHIRDAAQAMDRGQFEAANRHLSAAAGNMTPQSLRRHGLLTDEQHDQAKRSMDAVHRHILLVKDIIDLKAQNDQLPRKDPADAPGVEDDDLTNKPVARQPGGDKALNAPATTNVGRIDINVSKPQQVTNPKAAHQIAASNGDLTTSIDLVGPKGYSHGWIKSGGATEAVAEHMGERGTPRSEMPRLSPSAKRLYSNLRTKGHSHEHAMRAVRALGRAGGAVGRALGAGEATESIVGASNDQAGLEFAGPKGYVHGWIKVGDSGAASFHGKRVEGLTPTGSRVRGTYDHRRGNVIFGGKGIPVTSIHRMGAVGALRDMYSKDQKGVGSGEEDTAANYAKGKIPGVPFANDGSALEFVGPKGYVHGWIKVDPGDAQSKALRARGFGEGDIHTVAHGRAVAAAKSRRELPAKVGTPEHAAELRSLAQESDRHQLSNARLQGQVHGGTDMVQQRLISGYDKSHVEPAESSFALKRAADMLDRGQPSLAREHAPALERAAAVEQAAGIRPDYARRLSAAAAKLRELPAGQGLAAQPKETEESRLRTEAARAYAAGKGHNTTPTKEGFQYNPDGTITKVKAGDVVFKPNGGMSRVRQVRPGTIQFSAETARLAVTPAPRGRPGGPGLYNVKGNMHSPYMQNIVKALIEKRGMPPGKAYAIAWGSMRKWSRGGGKVHPEVRAAAAGGLAQEKVAEARAAGHSNILPALEMTGTAAGSAKDTRSGVTGQYVPAGSGGGGGAKKQGQQQPAKGKQQSKPAGPSAHQQHVAHEKHQIQGQINSNNKKIGQLEQQKKGLLAALASAAGKTSSGQSGSTTSSNATTKTTAPTTTAAAAASTTSTAASTTSSASTSSSSGSSGGLSTSQISAQIATVNGQIATLRAQNAKLTKQMAAIH